MKARLSLTGLTDNMTGFQPCNFTSSAPWFAADVAFTHEDRRNVLNVNFSHSLSLAMGERASFSYMAVPILFHGDCAYGIGGAAGVRYRNPLGDEFAEDFTATVTLIGPPGSRVRFPAATTSAIRSSDYLLVTSPPNLQSAYGASGALNVISNLAELASIRGGVLGYYHALGIDPLGLRGRRRGGGGGCVPPGRRPRPTLCGDASRPTEFTAMPATGK